MTRNWLVTDEEFPVDLATGLLDNLDGVGVPVPDELPRNRKEPIQPSAEVAPAAEEISKRESRTGFYAATGVIVLVGTWLGVYVHHAIQTGVFW